MQIPEAVGAHRSVQDGCQGGTPHLRFWAGVHHVKVVDYGRPSIQVVLQQVRQLLGLAGYPAAAQINERTCALRGNSYQI
jgi:hypothetical protein